MIAFRVVAPYKPHGLCIVGHRRANEIIGARFRGGSRMRLEQICDLEMEYREEAVYGTSFVLIRHYGGEEGSGYGEGDATFTGPRLQGSARWVNHPHRRSDGSMMPDAHG